MNDMMNVASERVAIPQIGKAWELKGTTLLENVVIEHFITSDD